MDVIIDMIVETVIYLVAYLVDWLRWWRFIVSVLVAGIASLVSYHFSTSSNVLPLVFAVVIPVFGITAGFIWEYKTQKDDHVA